MSGTERINGRLYCVELASADDIPDLLQIEQEAFTPEVGWSKDAFQKELERRPLGIKVVREGNKVIGYVQAQVGYEDTLDRQDRGLNSDGVIGSLAVLKDFRGRGVGETLLRSAVDYLNELGVPRIVASTNASNTVMVRLCTKIGFKIVGKTEGFYRSGEDSIDFELTG